MSWIKLQPEILKRSTPPVRTPCPSSCNNNKALTMSSGGKLARLKSAALKVAALINAVEKNSNFRQLASYSINVLLKAVRALESLDLRASNVVMAALAEHPQSLEMLSCASDCLAALAEDPRQAQTPKPSPRVAA